MLKRLLSWSCAVKKLVTVQADLMCELSVTVIVTFAFLWVMPAIAGLCNIVFG